MAEEVKNDNNMKIAVAIIVFLALVVMSLLFLLMQNKNNASSSSTDSTSEDSVATTAETSDASAIGKNELKLTDDNFKTEVEDYKGVVLVDFYLSTCPHCQNVAKDVTAVSDELVGKAKVGKIDAKANSVNAEKYKIEGVPTFIVFKDGKAVETVSGEKTKQELIDMVNKHL